MNSLIASDATATVPDDFGPGWYAIASSRELKQDKPLALTRFGKPLVAFRSGESVSVMLDRCPHRGVQLSAGTLEDGKLVCPFHGFHFDASGACTKIPALGSDGTIPKAISCTVLPAQELHGFLFVWWGDQPATLPRIDWFDEELNGCEGPYERWQDCEVGLSRNIENQLDMAHVPIVHRNSIGRFARYPRIEVECSVKDQRLRFWRKNGTPHFFIELRLPNIWINCIGPQTYVFLAFAPITATRTRLYTRYYQGRFKVPVLKSLFGWLMGWSNLWILNEDLRVIKTHDTKVSPPLDGTELLLPFDLPIIEYRRLRAKWQKTE